MKVEKRPTICNLCGGSVILVRNDHVYGKNNRPRSGYVYLCLNCRAYVETHVKKPKDAIGLLGNNKMRFWRAKCHELMDTIAFSHDEKQSLYYRIGNRMGIPNENCHFSHMTLEQLRIAHDIMTSIKNKMEKNNGYKRNV